MDEVLHKPAGRRPRQSDGRELSAQEQLGLLARRVVTDWKHFYQWARFHGRRVIHTVHDLAGGNRATGPVTFLAVSGALGLALTVSTLYAPAYTVTVDGDTLGVVSDQAVVADAVAQVERRGTEILGHDYQVEGQIGYDFTLSLRSELTQPDQVENYFLEQLSQVADGLRRYQVSVNGVTVGSVEEMGALESVLDQLKGQYVNENTISAEFVDDIQVEDVYSEEGQMTAEELQTALMANTTGDTTYTVVKGDTFNAIAYANDMSVSDLKALNPGIDINRLMIGDVLNVKEQIPLLSVTTVDDVTYTEPIACPVEEVKDSSMYVGDSKILTQGTEGEAQVHAQVTYVNGSETQREILSSTTLREPTTTVKAVGTKEKPKTASKGYFIWPIRGRITSYFGGRNIFGSYSYHSGIDISASYGAAIKAADGGTVTFAGYKGSYGYLVIITHDNGTQTYYGHNSSLLVSAGQKVYKGQQIAKAGSTGRSTGTHCHFEVRVNGTSVNPLSYLS